MRKKLKKLGDDRLTWIRWDEKRREKDKGLYSKKREKYFDGLRLTRRGSEIRITDSAETLV